MTPAKPVILSGRTAHCADSAVMTRPLTRRFAAPSPRFAGRGISREVLLPACGEKVVLSGAKDRMRGVIRSEGGGRPGAKDLRCTTTAIERFALLAASPRVHRRCFGASRLSIKCVNDRIDLGWTD